MTDIRVEYKGSINLFHPLTEAGREAIERGNPEYMPLLGEAMVVDHRMSDEVIYLMIERDGLEVEF